jgi:hypothetical protein
VTSSRPGHVSNLNHVQVVWRLACGLLRMART